MAILCYHTVDDEFRSRLSLTPAQFEEHCRWLTADRDVVDLATAAELMDERGRLPHGIVALSFDDGLEGVYRHVYPALVRHGLPATVFLVADTLTGAHPEVDWIDGVAPGSLRAMSLEQVHEMAADGITFASHSSCHLDLTSLDPERCEADLLHSREVLEDVLGSRVRELAYPRGRHGSAVRAAARRAGFERAYGLPERREPWGDLSIPRIGVYAHNHLPTLRIKTARGYLSARTSGLHPAARALVRTVRRASEVVRGDDDADPSVVGRVDTVPTEPTRAVQHVGYMMSRFPKVSETFILDEIVELRRRGVRVDVYPLLRERQSVQHPEALVLTREARFQPMVSWRMLGSHVWFLRRHPRRYLRMLRDVLAGTARSLNFLVGALGILPKTVHMARLMQRDGVQHVHCHFATHPALAGLIVHRLTGIPYSFTAHGSDLHVRRRMLDRKVAEAAFVVAISEYNRQLILDESASEHHGRVHVVHCGVDLTRFRTVPARGGEPPLRVVCIGTLHEVKGQTVLVDVCAALRDRGQEIDCRLVGDGPDRHELERRVRKAGLGGSISFRGSRTREEVVAELRRADVLVAPSVPTAEGKREGIPVVLMEAMAMARPVVASRLSGIPELVEDGVSGLLVPPGDVLALADALHRLTDDVDLRRRLGAQGRRTVEARFSLHGNVDRLVELMGNHGREGV